MKVGYSNMIDIKDINNNIIVNRWKARYAQLPNEIKEKLDELDNKSIEEYQLQVIKRERIYPQVGDVFQIKPSKDIELYGLVVNNHINNINGEDLIVVLIFKNKANLKESITREVKSEDLLILPQIIGKEYWTKGYFYNIDHYNEMPQIGNYGFYSVGKGKFFDEYGKEIEGEPSLLGIYGVATIIGVAGKINQELIIAGII